MRKHHFLVIVLVFVAVTGCGRGFVQVTGKVTYEDGSPVPFGGIVFETENFMSEGRIQSDGRYTLSSLELNDGLPPGTYRVSVSSMERDANERPIYHVDPKFSNPSTSELFAEVVKRGSNQFDFTVTKPKQ